MTRLTTRGIEALKPTGKDQYIADGGNLYLRVTPSGSKPWVFRYTSGGKAHRMQIGIYPGMSLAEARQKAAELTIQRQRGIDPLEGRQAHQDALKAEQQAKAARMTVSTLFSQWQRSALTQYKDGGAYVTDVFTRHVLPVIGPLPIEDLTKRQVAELVETVKAKGRNGGNGRMAQVAFSYVRQLFVFAIEHDYLEHNPTDGIRKSRIVKAVERDRALSQAELRQLAQLLPRAGLAHQSQLAVKAILVTACRIGEITTARLADINLEAGTWRIPASTAKNGTELVVTLSDFAKPIFQEFVERANSLHSEFLMPATNATLPDSGTPAPVCPKSLTKQLTDRQRGDKPAMKGRSPHTSALILPGGLWRSHDLRRTAASLMAELGVQPHVVERCLNHTEQNKMVRVYQRHQYAPEMAAAWRRLGDQLALLMAPQSNNISILKQT